MKKKKIMKLIKKYFSVLFTVFLFASCEKEIEFKGKITEPQVVVNSFITPDSVIKVHVSESKFFLEKTDSFNSIVNADISVLINGVLKEKMIYSASGIYLANYKPVVGDTVRLEVKIPNRNDVSSQTIIEPAIQLIDLDTTKLYTGKYPIINYNPITTKADTIGYYSNYDCHFKLKFKDEGAKDNFYRLTVRTHTIASNGRVSDDYFFVFDDIVSGKTTSSTVGPPTSLSSNQYNVFSDELFNGKEYPLTFYITNSTAKLFPEYEYLANQYGDSGQKEIYVNLQSISKSYYLYLKSRDASISSNGFFSEPIQIHNNIIGGIGIFGSYTSNVFEKIDL